MRKCSRIFAAIFCSREQVRQTATMFVVHTECTHKTKGKTTRRNTIEGETSRVERERDAIARPSASGFEIYDNRFRSAGRVNTRKKTREQIADRIVIRDNENKKKKEETLSRMSVPILAHEKYSSQITGRDSFINCE